MNLRNHLGLILSCLILQFSSSALGFNNFKLSKVGNWEAVSTIIEGPQKGYVTKKITCMSKADLSNPQINNPSPQCKTKIKIDTVDAAESEQNCDFGTIKVFINMKMEKIDKLSYELITASKAGGIATVTKTITKYVGPCDSQPAQESTIKSNIESCKSCEANIKKLEATCKSVPKQAAGQCYGSLIQMKNVCKVECK